MFCLYVPNLGRCTQPVPAPALQPAGPFELKAAASPLAPSLRCSALPMPTSSEKRLIPASPAEAAATWETTITACELSLWFREMKGSKRSAGSLCRLTLEKYKTGGKWLASLGKEK